MVKSFFASSIVTPTTLSSIKRVAGSKRITATGAMYKSRFIELSFSLQDGRIVKSQEWPKNKNPGSIYIQHPNKPKYLNLRACNHAYTNTEKN
jgi:hypothetical protein